jgi:hypothetical protein
MFIRAGDKAKEAAPMSVAAHFKELQPIAEALGVKDVYVGSDSWDRIAEAVDQFGSNYTIHFIDWHRPASGIAWQDVASSTGTWRMTQLVRLALADLFITAQSDVLVGTLSSNWARLSDMIRRANGKARVPVATPEKVLMYSRCEHTGVDGFIGSEDHVRRIADIVSSIRGPVAG